MRRSPLPLLALAALLVLVLPPPAAARLPSLPGVGASTAAGEGKESPPAKEPPSLKERAEAKLRELEESPDYRIPPPRGVAPSEASERGRLLGKVRTFWTLALNLADDLEAARKQRLDAEERLAAWKGYGADPPDSIRKLDEVAGLHAAASLRRKEVASARETFRKELARHQDALREAMTARRRGDEALEARLSPEMKALQEWRRGLSALSAEGSLAGVSWAEGMVALQEEKEGAARAEEALLGRMLEEARSRVRFAPEELARIRESLAEERGPLEAEWEATIRDDASTGAAVARLEGELAALRKASPGGGAGSRREASLDARLRSARARRDASRVETEALTFLVSLNQALGRLWQVRFEALSRGGAAALGRARAEFREARDRIQPWVAHAEREAGVAKAEEEAYAARLLAIDRRDPVRDELARTAEAVARRKRIAERMAGSLSATEDRLVLWIEDMEARYRSRSLATRAEGWWLALSGAAQRAWGYELLAVEDTVEVGGQKVTTTRSVSVRKVVTALALFVLGWGAAARLSRLLAGRLLVRRMGLGEQQANVLRRWITSGFVVVLLILSFSIVRIPLTVFHFLGGALAIGIGFGTQTMIRNFISGLLILAERKVRVGDVVDVDGVVGTVTAVDLRACTVRAFDGVETMVPNSTFLEQKVGNWTHSDLRQRRSVKVGVAYGSDPERVREILRECAASHGDVLGDPPPLVLFEQFGESSLDFAVYYWIDLRLDLNPAEVASDIRFRIGKALAEGGVAIPFPQRDLHLDAERPLRVEVVGRDGGAGPGGGGEA